MGPVPQPVFKTGEVVQPTAGSVRLRGRSASTLALGSTIIYILMDVDMKIRNTKQPNRWT